MSANEQPSGPSPSSSPAEPTSATASPPPGREVRSPGGRWWFAYDRWLPVASSRDDEFVFA